MLPLANITMVPPSPRLTVRAKSPFATYSPYSNFHLPSSSESSDAGDDDGELPFPAALLRNDFLKPNFEPAAYLSSLFPSEDGTTSAQRHQTLEDLRTELRERSNAISAELLELVNANYTSFLSLGDELRGGDEKVEDVRVALFGFRRSVEDIQNHVRERRIAVDKASHELSDVRSSINIGRKLLELDSRISLLEERLSIARTTGGLNASGRQIDNVTDMDNGIWGVDETDEEDEDETLEGVAGFYVGSSPAKLTALARGLVLATQVVKSLDPHTPFVKTAEERLAKCQGTLLLDLNSAVKESRKASSYDGQSRLLKILAVYRILDSENEAVRALGE